MVVGHPLGENRAAPADDAGDALRNQRQILHQHSGMDGHVVHALLGLLFDHLEHQIDVQVFNALHARNRLVDRHRPDGHRRMPQNRLANFADTSAGREVHHRIRAVMDCGVQLLQLFIDIGRNGRVADIGVDLAQRSHADGHRFQFRMVDIGGDDHASGGDFVADELGGQLLALGDEHHLFGDQSLAGKVHLREIVVTGLRGFRPAAGNPLLAGLWG